MDDLQGLLKFQIKRQLLNTGKTVLELLENNDAYIKRLEKLLIDAGFENFEKNNYNYDKDRAKVLSRVNDGWRELFAQLDLFEITIKKS